MALSEKIEKLIKPRCCECGDVLENLPASKNPSFSKCCDKCLPVKNLKNSWRPLGNGQVSRIFILNSKP